MKQLNWPNIFLFTCLAVVFKTDPANAYLDPGTASLVLQGIVGAVGAGIVASGIYWRKFTSLFRKGEPKGAENEALEPAPRDRDDH
ncbi:MAG: hypothetical protein ACREH3_11390 [Geminicoccales bacterium]